MTVTRPDANSAQLLPAGALMPGDSCSATVRATQVRDVDGDDPPDTMSGDFSWSFTMAVTADQSILINEVDADTSGTDDREFIELYDGGRGNQPLDGLVLVLYNGANDTSYRAIDLTGEATNGAGYFVVGSAGLAAAGIELPTGSIQNGPDAVALYAGSAADFPNGTAIHSDNLIDAVVYDTGDDDDPELLTLLQSGQPQVDEAARGDKDGHSNQRCPDGSGGPRQTQTFAQSDPTPGQPNICVFDSAPAVIQTMPAPGEAGVPLDAVLTVTFSEAVNAMSPWASLTCGQSGDHLLTVTGGPASYRLVPDRSFASGERCEATVRAAASSRHPITTTHQTARRATSHGPSRRPPPSAASPRCQSPPSRAQGLQVPWWAQPSPQRRSLWDLSWTAICSMRFRRQPGKPTTIRQHRTGCLQPHQQSRQRSRLAITCVSLGSWPNRTAAPRSSVRHC